MAERIASGEIFVEVNDRAAIGRLNAIRSEYHRTMEAIDREEATATIDADTSKFDRKIKDAQALLAKMEDAEATAKIDADAKPLKKALAAANKELADFEKKEPKASLAAKSARLKDELRIARAALKQFGTEEAQAKIKAENKQFIAKYEETQALVKKLDAQSADVEVKLKGYETLRKHISTLENDIEKLHKNSAKAAEDRDKAEQALADAQKARDDATLAHSQKVDAAREKAAQKRAKAIEQLAEKETAFEERQMAKRLTALRRESKIRDDVHKARERTARGREEARLDLENNKVFALQGQYGNLVRNLERLNEARRKAAGSQKALAVLDEKEIRTRERMAQFERRLGTIDKLKAERAEVPALEAAYARLNNQLEELNKKRRNAVRDRDQRGVFTIDLDARKVINDMDKLGAELRRRTGSDPVVFHVEPRLAERAGERMRADFIRTWQRSNWGSRLSGVIMSPIESAIRGPLEEAAGRAGRIYRNRFRREVNGGRGLMGNLSDAGTAVSGAGMRGLEMMRRFGEGIQSATVRLGPFTLTVRKAMGALALFGPVLVDVVGAAGALIGVLGSAAVGVGALGLAVAGGFIPAALGMGLVIKDVVQEFAAVKKATKAYDAAVLKNGASSTQAAKKQKELQNVMGGVSKTTADQVKLAQGLGTAWDKATRPGRASVWKAIGEGIQAADKMLPMFARNTNRALDQTEKGLTKWARALSSADGQAVLSTMMRNANRSIQPLLGGLGQLLAYLGKVGAVASGSLPGLSKTFERWAKGLNDSADGSDKFVGKINNVIDSTKTVGRTFMATGRFMKAFFGAGVRDGQSFADTMTNKLNSWTSKINADPSGLQNFFKESVAGAKSLYGFLAPIASTFVGWARALSPIARAFFDGAAAVGRFVQAIAEATAMQGPLQALAVTLGTLWAVGKIGTAAAAVGRFIAALAGIRGVAAGGTAAMNAQAAAATRLAAANQRAAATGVAATAASTRAAMAGAAVARGAAVRGAAGGMGAGTAAALGAGAAAATRPVTRLARAGSVATRVLGGLGAATIGVGTVLGGLAVVAGLAGVGLYMYHNRTRESERATKRLNDASVSYQRTAGTLMDGNLQLAQGTLQATSATLDLRNAQKQASAEQKRMTQLERAGKKSSQEYKDVQAQHRQTVLQLSNARLTEQNAQRQQIALQKTEKAAIKETVVQASKAQQASMDRAAAYADEHGKDLKRYSEVEQAAKRTGKSMERMSWEMFGSRGDNVLEAGRDYAAILKDQGRASEQFAQAQARAVLANGNLKRAMQGLGPIAERHAKSFASLGSRIQSALTSNKRPASYADPAKAAGVTNAAARAKTSGVKEQKIIDIIVNSKSADAAIRKLNALTLKQKKMDVSANVQDALASINGLNNRDLKNKVMKILASDGDAKSKVAALIALGIPPKTAKMLGNNTDALAKAAQANGTTLRSLIQQIMRNINNPGNLFANLAPITQTINRVIKTSGGKYMGIPVGNASGSINLGSGVETKATRSAMDRSVDRASRGSLPRMSTTQAQKGQRFQGARMIVGEEPQYSETVISENPSYRKSNIEALKAAARALGVAMHSSGTAAAKRKKARAKPATDSQRNKATSQARANFGKKGKKGKPVAYATENLVQLPQVEAAKRDENNFRDQLSREASMLDKQEPTSFLRDTGQKSPNGDPIMAVDQPAIEAWNAKLVAFAGRVQQLIEKINATLRAVMSAMAEIGDPVSKKGGVIGASQKNIETLNSLITGEKSRKAKAKSKAAKQMADTRINWYEGQLSDQRGVQSSAVADWKMLDDERNDIGDETRGRMADAMDNKATYLADAGVGGTSKAAASAGSDLASDPGANYKPDAPTTIAETMGSTLDDLDLEKTLAGIGQGFKGKPMRDIASIDNDRKNTAQAMIDQGNSMLTDSDPTNDDAGRSLIGTGTGVLTDLTPAANAAMSIQDAFNNASAAQKDLYKQFGSNVISNGGTIADMMRSGGAGNVMRGANQPGGQGGGDTYVNVKPQFKTQPSDPHLWSRDVAFELQAAL